jgi:hypothetical protein
MCPVDIRVRSVCLNIKEVLTWLAFSRMGCLYSFSQCLPPSIFRVQSGSTCAGSDRLQSQNSVSVDLNDSDICNNAIHRMCQKLMLMACITWDLLYDSSFRHFRFHVVPRKTVTSSRWLHTENAQHTVLNDGSRSRCFYTHLSVFTQDNTAAI